MKINLQVIITGIIFAGIIGCTSTRQKSAAQKVINLIKAGKYNMVKKICHYQPSWDPVDSIFNENMHFIHNYIEKYGTPSSRDYIMITDSLQKSKEVKILLKKASGFDTTLQSAYIEMDFYNPAHISSEAGVGRAKKKTLGTFMKLAPPFIDNFYLIKMKKDKDSYIHHCGKSIKHRFFSYISVLLA